MKAISIIGFIFVGLGGLIGLTMLPGILKAVDNGTTATIDVVQMFGLVWCSGVVLTFFACAILYVAADRVKKGA